MHQCPRCDFECDCSGDIDDSSVMSDEWVFKNCQCGCEEPDSEQPDDDDDWYDEHDGP